jgi:catechol 2,3-dioxygenase-like lactoylglutathione lyase family enzyme
MTAPADEKRIDWLFRGVDHVGVGVGDMPSAVDWFGRVLGFDQVIFDYVGELPGLEEITHRERTRARIVMLASRCATPLGPGRIKLVQVLEDGGTPPLPGDAGWGELGICEVCVHARDVRSVHRRLIEAHGCVELMKPVVAKVTPFDLDVDLSYVADPEGGKVEILEWKGLWRALPGDPRLEGVNHVAFGVADMSATREFYARLGFTHLVLESDGYFEPMRPWYAREMPRQHMILVLPGQGAGIEPVRLHPETVDRRGEWGHRGPMEFAIGVSHLERAYAELGRVGVRFLSEPQVVELGNGEWRYAYLEDPDGLYVSLVEARY